MLQDYLSLLSDSTNLKEDIGKSVLRTDLAYVHKRSGTSEAKSVIKLQMWRHKVWLVYVK